MPGCVRQIKTAFSSSLKLDQIKQCETVLLKTAFIYRSEIQNDLFLEMQIKIRVVAKLQLSGLKLFTK